MITYLLLLFAPVDYTGAVAAEAAYVLHTHTEEKAECCGACKDGMIRHGDGHVTPCPCPEDCKCKTKGAVIHPPAILKDCPTCPAPKK